MKLFFIILLILYQDVSYSFNVEDCKRNFTHSYWNPLVLFQAKDPSGFTTLLPLAPTSTSSLVSQSFNSSAQFVSSSGNCKAYDFNKHKKMHFITNNLISLRNESAIGSGEVLDAFSALLECDKEGSEKLKSMLKDNFEKIYYKDNENTNSIYVYEKIKIEFSNNSLFVKHCNNGF